MGASVATYRSDQVWDEDFQENNVTEDEAEAYDGDHVWGEP